MGLEVLDRRDRHHRRLEPVGRCGDAAAERRDRECLRPRRDDLRARLAAHPARHRHGLGSHILEAERAQPLHGPGHCACVAGRTGESRTHFGGERADQFVGSVVGERPLAQGAGFGECSLVERTGRDGRQGEQADGEPAGEAYE